MPQNNFDYKSIGAYYSHRVSGMPGKITRLLACSKEQSAKYTGWDLGPTFVHDNYGHIQQTRELLPGEAKAPYGSRKTDRRAMICYAML